MKHLILGTAGHVDHGKTRLIRALTGIDTDRLAEEKRRGLTIEPGFAHLELEDGIQLGIVDVPGHERFIRNMLTGAGGVDLGMLVIDAVEGVMPQTKEHLQILCLLGIRDGLVVITKSDLADAECLRLAQAEARELVRGSFLEEKPILSVSSVTGEGLDALKQCLHDMALCAGTRNTRLPFRLPIDRVFHAEGFGTVVTGTLTEGIVRSGDAVELFPSGLRARVRGLQVHGKAVDFAEAGQRVALNLSGLRRGEAGRGEIAAAPGSLRCSSLLDVRLSVLPDCRRVIRSASSLHLHIGTRELMARAVLLDRDALNGGECALAQLRLTEPVAVRPGDRFVVRFFSPLETVGGGIILDEAPRRHKRYDPAVLSALVLRESGTLPQRLVQAVKEQGTALPDAARLGGLLHRPPPDLEAALAALCSSGELTELLPGRYIAAAVLDSLWERCRQMLESCHRDRPLEAGMHTAELRQKLLRGTDAAASDAILDLWERERRLRIAEGYTSLPGFHIALTLRQKALREELLSLYRSAGLCPPVTDSVPERFPAADRGDVRRILAMLAEEGALTALSPQLCVCREAYDQALQLVLKHFSSAPTLTLAEFRDMLGISRKYAAALLEHFDRIRLTRRDGNLRRLLYRNFSRSEN